jgi:H(+)-transporting ATP synthase subunit D
VSIPATRQNLLGGIRQLDQVNRGMSLLRRKREALVSELFKLARPAAEHRRTIADRAQAAWPLLLDALAQEGQAGIRALGWPFRELKAEMRSGQVWGIPVTEILERTPVRRSLAARGTPAGPASPEVTRAASAFEDLTDALLEAAGREALLRRLGEALAQTSRQVNTLEQQVTPRLSRQISEMRRTLEEREREDRVRLIQRRGVLASRSRDR